MWENIRIILTAREPGEGYFGGAEGAIRFLLLSFIAFMCSILYLVLR